MIYFSSDEHFLHSRQFIYEPRGFNSVEEMNETIIENWNKTVSMNDTIYVLGDFFLGQDYDFIDRTLKRLNGDIHLIIGNHDTGTRINLYKQCPNVVSVDYALRLKIKKYHLWLSHYPTITANYDDDKPWAKHMVNIYGHTKLTYIS